MAELKEWTVEMTVTVSKTYHTRARTPDEAVDLVTEDLYDEYSENLSVEPGEIEVVSADAFPEEDSLQLEEEDNFGS